MNEYQSQVRQFLNLFFLINQQIHTNQTKITMIILPWYIRFGIDCVIVWAPFFYIQRHPTLFFEYFANNRRIKRRRDFTEIEAPKDAFMTVEQTKKFYSELGIEI